MMNDLAVSFAWQTGNVLIDEGWSRSIDCSFTKNVRAFHWKALMESDDFHNRLSCPHVF